MRHQAIQIMDTVTEDEYLNYESTSTIRHEYYSGYVVAMAGDTANHNKITLNLATLLHSKLPEGCELYSSDMRLKVKGQKEVSYRYPDVWVRCGNESLTTETTGEDACLIIEVMSHGTRTVDETYKVTEYAEALKHCNGEYLMVDSERHYVILKGWVNGRFITRRKLTSTGLIYFESIKSQFSVEDIYQKILLN
ncbi:Uma2 family endonuclease [Endozoicomonas sp. ISHI1]|uniref:Uma2 family endonuclease n=1 Tax=Endozoicomonas sp. ISHI1 TaxID=2825882 RepID=UPI002149107D|nr:Uma2 family endonuclease [Endozoicomonas sp. ISHI1]